MQYAVIDQKNERWHMVTGSEREANKFALRLARNTKADYTVLEFNIVRRVYWCQDCRAAKSEVPNGS